MNQYLRRHAGEAAFAGVAALLVTVVLLLGAASWWCYGLFAAEAARYRNYQSLRQEAGRADSLAATYGKALEAIKAIRQAMPPENQGSHALNLLTESARNHRLVLAEVNALDVVPFPGYVELPFELGLAGDFPDLVRYLHSLETQGMVLRVRRLAARNESLNKKTLQARLEVSAFVPGARAPRDTTAGRFP